MSPVTSPAARDAEAARAPRSNAAANVYAGSAIRQWWLVAVLTCVAMLGGIDRQIMSLLIEPIKTTMGVSDTQISLIYGFAFALANVACLLPAGYLADRMDRRLLLGLGLAIWSVATMACGLAASYTVLFVARAFVGGGESVLQPGALSLLRNGIRKPWLGRAFSIYAMAIMLGTAMAMLGGGAIIGLLAHHRTYTLPVFGTLFSWQIVLLLLGLLGAPAGLLLTTLREPARCTHSPQSDGLAQAWAFIVQHRAIFAPLLLFNASAGMLTLSYGAWVTPILIRSWGYSLSTVGALLGLMMLVIPPIGLLITGAAIDRLARSHGARGVATVGLVAITALTVTSIGVPLMPSKPLLWINMVFALLTSGTCFPITNTIVAMIAPPSCLGRISSIQYLVYGVIGASIGPTLVALVADHAFTGRNALGYALTVTCTAYGLIAFVLLACARRALATA